MTLKTREQLCAEWQDLNVFLQAIGKQPSGCKLRRFDTSKPFGPGNWFWAKKGDPRVVNKSRRMYTHNGETLTMSGWAKRLGVTRERMRQRFNHYPVDVAIEGVGRKLERTA